MAIDLQKLEQKFNALFEGDNFVTEFEQWLDARNVSQPCSKPIVGCCTSVETAMQELIIYIKNFRKENEDTYVISCMAKSLLNKERQQIVDAHYDGQFYSVSGEESVKFSEKYFNKTFKH